MTDKKNKVGRPKGANSNVVKITVRISESLNEKIENISKKNNISKPDTIRQALKEFTEK